MLRKLNYGAARGGKNKQTKTKKGSKVGGRRSAVGTSESGKGTAHERDKSGGRNRSVGKRSVGASESKRNEREQATTGSEKAKHRKRGTII